MQEIKEYKKESLNKQQFHDEIVAAKSPVILRGLVSHWPVVQKANNSLQETIDYLLQIINDHPSYTIVAPPSENGRLFFSEDLTGVNFKSVNGPIPSTIKQLLAMQNNATQHAISVQAALLNECAPTFKNQHDLPLLDNTVEPTMWISNQSRVAAHFDLNDNIAAVAVGRRRFTLFPPEQTANLYIGPILNSPGGVPTSLVDIKEPDFNKFPRFTTALKYAQFAELLPGDAIFIPSPWWHSVESLDPFNVLINYWWNKHLDPKAPNAINCMALSMLTIAKMDRVQRKSWKAMFDYFVFKESGDASEHLPSTLNDFATALDVKQLSEFYEHLGSKLKAPQ